MNEERMTRFADWDDNDLLDELIEIESGLSTWESEFIDDLARRRRLRGGHLTLTDRQRAKLEQILETHYED